MNWTVNVQGKKGAIHVQNMYFMEVYLFINWIKNLFISFFDKGKIMQANLTAKLKS